MTKYTTTKKKKDITINIDLEKHDEKSEAEMLKEMLEVGNKVADILSDPLSVKAIEVQARIDAMKQKIADIGKA